MHKENKETPEVPTRLKLLLLGMTIVLSPEDIYVFKFPDWEDIKLKHDHCFGQCYYFTFELVYVYQPKNVSSVNSKCLRVIFFRKKKIDHPSGYILSDAFRIYTNYGHEFSSSPKLLKNIQNNKFSFIHFINIHWLHKY